jgi:hypothetical protein
MLASENQVEKYILEKYGELLGIYEDIAPVNPNINPARSARNETDTYSIRAFSTGYIIYLKNPRLGDDFDNGVPRGSPFDQGIKYSGNVRAITHIRYLKIFPDNHSGMGYIAIFERDWVQIYRITTDPDKNGITEYLVFPRPEVLTDAAIPQIRAFSWSRDDVRFHFN